MASSRTPDSTAAPYCDAATLLLAYDARTVGDLASDSGTRLNPAQVTAPSAVVQQMLLSASGMVEAACLRAGRYRPADLAALTGASLAYLQQLVADLAMGLLIRRRPDRKLPLPPAFTAALEALEAISAGDRVFGELEVEQAGGVNVYQETARDVWARDLIVTQAGRFFGRRADRHQGYPW